MNGTRWTITVLGVLAIVGIVAMARRNGKDKDKQKEVM
jgi:hypothetical protein